MDMSGDPGVAGRVSAPGYQIVRFLGSGAFGSVYVAEQTSTHRHVALKVLSVGLGSPRDRERFDDEVRTLALLDSHPHIVDLLDYGFLDDQRPFFAMRYSPEGSVAEEVRDAVLPTERLLQVGIGTAAALGAAHELGILHRDVKPANLLLSSTGSPLLADFGVAVARARADQVTGAYTDGYAAPEVLTDGDYSPASDQYALGVTLYELAAGQRPFRATSIGKLADEVRYLPPPPIDRPDLPLALVAAIERTLAKRPDERFASLTQFAEALQAVEATAGFPRTALAVWRAPAALAPSPLTHPQRTDGRQRCPQAPNRSATARPDCTWAHPRRSPVPRGGLLPIPTKRHDLPHPR